MSSDLATVLPALALTCIFDALSLYAIYLSISVRRGLTISIYRSRALWMVFLGVSAAIALTYYGFTIVFPSSSFASFEVVAILTGINLGVILILIDRTVNTVIRLDYLRRDVLHWKKSRFVYGAAMLLFYILFFSRYVDSFPDTQGIALVPFFSALVYGVLAVAKGTTITRDATFRSHVMWFGYVLATYIAGEVVYFLPISRVIDLFIYVLASFCYYKMARFLVPVGKLSPLSVTDLSTTSPTSQC
jgi:hypothetical protein